jgi:hypothetical protein
MSISTRDTVAGSTSTAASMVGGIDQGNAGFINFSGDSDWYRMTLVAGQSYRFEARRVSGVDPTLTLRNSAGTQIAFNDDGGGFPNSLINFTATTSGTYFLDVRGFGSTTGSYRVLAYTPGDQLSSTATTTSIAGEQQQTDFIGVNGDSDWRRISLVAGRTYTFSLDGQGPNALADPTLTLRNSAGTQIAFNDDRNGSLDRNSRITFTAASSGTYFLDARAFANAGSGRYRLDVDDTAASTATHRNLSIAGVPNGTASAAGRINHSGDRDWFRITLRAGELYQLEANTGAGTTGVGDPALTLRNSAGTQLAFNDDASGLNARILYRPTSTATFYLDVAGFGSRIGNYSVVAREVPANTSTHSNLAVNGSVRGDLHANGDQDWHRITLSAGRRYRFDLRGSSTGNGSLSDPFFELRNSSGTLLASNDDGGTGLDSRLQFTASTTGTYFANARAFNNSGTGTYRLGATLVA